MIKRMKEEPGQPYKGIRGKDKKSTHIYICWLLRILCPCDIVVPWQNAKQELLEMVKRHVYFVTGVTMETFRLCSPSRYSLADVRRD
jgi:hypothetical protein